MLYYRIINAIYARLFAIFLGFRFKKYGRKTSIIFPAGIEGAEHISLANNVYIGYKSYLAAKPLKEDLGCVLQIGAGTSIGRFNHIYATGQIIIGENVLTANNVYISDNLHGYGDPDVPIMQQPVIQKRSVEIGSGSWLGHGVCVIGVKIGRHCVVGANSVVTHDIPDHCVVVGVPAKIIRRYDHASRHWRATLDDGTFVE